MECLSHSRSSRKLAQLGPTVLGNGALKKQVFNSLQVHATTRAHTIVDLPHPHLVIVVVPVLNDPPHNHLCLWQSPVPP